MTTKIQADQLESPLYPESYFGFFGDWRVVSGGFTLSSTINSAYPFYTYWRPSTFADGHSIAKDILLDTGTYAFINSYRYATNRCIMDYALDGDVFLTQDMYAGGGANVEASGTVVVARPKLYTLSMTVNGKNASSTAYEWYTTYWSLVKQ